jgi:AcrR family transcriptional regulator
MKAEGAGKQRYRMKARAASAAATAARIIDAATQHFGARPYDEVTLADVARDAEVTVQTVLRRFGSKEGLVAAATEASLEAVRNERFASPVGDIAAAIRNLSEHYELWGDRSVLLLSQEARVESIRRLTDAGRALHHAWVDRAFSPWLGRVRGEAGRRLRAQLIAATDVYVWKVMRRDLGLDREATEASMRGLVEAAVGVQEGR